MSYSNGAPVVHHAQTTQMPDQHGTVLHSMRTPKSHASGDDLIELPFVDLTADEDPLDHRRQTGTQVDLTDEAEEEEPEQTIRQIETLPRSITIGNVTFGQGRNVELEDGTFMRIGALYRTANGRVQLLGSKFQRQTSFATKLPLRRNELVLCEQVETYLDECQAVAVRNRDIILTNRTWEDMSLGTQSQAYVDQANARDCGPLFCRIRRTYTTTNKRITGETWAFLDAGEADVGYRISQKAKRRNFRKNETVLGGSYSQNRVVTYTDTNEVHKEVVEIAQQYTFADAFCGAGGASCGALMAGLRPAWAFDHDDKAVQTYRLNFPTADCHQRSVENFIQIAQHDFMVDVLHISPPCQPFSSARTTGSDAANEINQAVLFSVPELLKVIRPRIVTMEETEGLVNRHDEYFGPVIRSFIQEGYSLRWTLATCGDFGTPQPTRRRLVLIAAGPGETLPCLPAPTHNLQPPAGSGLLKTPTVGDCIVGIPFDHPDHDVRCLFPVPRTPFPMNSYAKTVTCNSGVGNYHPSGLRSYSNRELACIQTFPLRFRFAQLGKVSIKKQIGNAVPPRMARTWYRQIIKDLAAADKTEALRNAQVTAVD